MIMVLLWISDCHLNHLRASGAAQTFGAYLGVEHDFDAVVVTGDIAEAPSVRMLLEDFARGVGKPVFFVLGNHDYYFGSIAGVEKEVGKIRDPNLVWLDQAPEPILLDPDTALVGQGGWYDGQFGDAEKSRVIMSDFELIKDFKPHYHERTWLFDYGGRADLLDKLRTLSKQHAKAARIKLLAALKLRRQVIFATHYPPFSGACWHEGNLSDPHWMPWFTSGYMGEMLGDVAADHPDNRILVLCGHTHSPGMYEHLPNLLVLTGKAVYGAPEVAGVLELPLQHWTGRPDRCDRCDDQDFESTATCTTCKTCQRTWNRGNGPWVLDPEP
jgi:predicted MPP superfamily phosphohydrolase